MQFPSRDLTSQSLCVTYVDMVQRYTSSAIPTDVNFLDGQGNVIEYVNITASNSVIAQYAFTAESASYATSTIMSPDNYTYYFNYYDGRREIFTK